MAVTNKNNSVKFYIHLAIMLVIMFGMRFVPPFLAVTPKGMAVLGAFVGWLYGVCFLDMCLACLIGFIAISFCGVMPINDYFVAGFGSETVILIIFGTIFIGGLIAKFDLTNLLLNKMFRIKFLYGRPWLFTGGLLILSYLVGTFTNPYVVVFMIYEIVITISKQAGFKPFSCWPSMMFIACTLMMSLTIINMPYKGTCLLFFGIFSQATGGLTVSWGAYVLWFNAIAILATIIYLLACRLIFRPDISALAELNSSIGGEAQKATTEQKIALALLGFFVVCMLGYGLVPESWAIKPYLTTMGLPCLAMLCITLALCIHVNGKPLMSFVQMAQDGIQWNVYMIIAFSIPLMSLLTNQDTGIAASLMMVLNPILGGHSPFVFVIVALIASVIMTNIFNNMVVIMIMTPILCGYALQMALNPAVVIVMLILCGYLAVLLPAGSPLTAIMYGYKDWVNMKTAWKYGGLCLIVFLVILLAVGLPLGNILL